MLRHILSGLKGLVLFVVGATVLLAVLGGGLLLWIWFSLDVLGPWQHARNTARAEATNAEIWERGVGQVYTVAVEATVDGRASRAAVDVVCGRKVETENVGIKGGPMRWDLPLNFGAKAVVLRLPGDREAVFDVDYPCWSLEEMVRKVPALPAAITAYARLPRLNNLKASFATCYGAPAAMLPPPMLLSVREAPVRTLVTREDYGPADRRVKRALKRARAPARAVAARPEGATFFWREAEQCWGPGSSPYCAAGAAEYCGGP